MDTEDQDQDQDIHRRSESHLSDVTDGCGCAEIWEHLSEHRTSD